MIFQPESMRNMFISIFRWSNFTDWSPTTTMCGNEIFSNRNISLILSILLSNRRHSLELISSFRRTAELFCWPDILICSNLTMFFNVLKGDKAEMNLCRNLNADENIVASQSINHQSSTIFNYSSFRQQGEGETHTQASLSVRVLQASHSNAFTLSFLTFSVLS